MLALILSIAAGAISRQVKDQLVEALGRVMLGDLDLGEEASLALSYAVCLLVVSVIIAISGSSISIVAVTLGGLIGLYAKQIIAIIRKQIG